MHGKIRDGIQFLDRPNLEPGFVKPGWEALKAASCAHIAMRVFTGITTAHYPDLPLGPVMQLHCLPALRGGPFFVNTYRAGKLFPDDRDVPEARDTITRVREGLRIPDYEDRLRFPQALLGAGADGQVQAAERQPRETPR